MKSLIVFFTAFCAVVTVFLFGTGKLSAGVSPRDQGFERSTGCGTPFTFWEAGRCAVERGVKMDLDCHDITQEGLYFAASYGERWGHGAKRFFERVASERSANHVVEYVYFESPEVSFAFNGQETLAPVYVVRELMYNRKLQQFTVSTRYSLRPFDVNFREDDVWDCSADWPEPAQENLMMVAQPMGTEGNPFFAMFDQMVERYDDLCGSIEDAWKWN